DHSSRDFATPEAVEPFVDLVQGVAPRDQLLDLDLARAGELDHAREVDPRPRRAIPGANDPGLLIDQHERVERGARALWSHADDARRTRDARHLDRLLHRLAVADDLEGVVDATAGQLADLFDGVPVRA